MTISYGSTSLYPVIDSSAASGWDDNETSANFVIDRIICMIAILISRERALMLEKNGGKLNRKEYVKLERTRRAYMLSI